MRWAILLVLGAQACARDPREASSSAPVTSTCSYIAGAWKQSSGSCAIQLCSFFEDNCALHIDCNGKMGPGAVNGNTITFGACTGTIAGTTITGTCTTGCDFVLTHF